MCAASQIAAHIQPLGKSNGLENPEAPDLSDEDDGMQLVPIILNYAAVFANIQLIAFFL